MVRIAFRVNANFKTGSGHLQRCIALASGLIETDKSCEVFFLTSDSAEYHDQITSLGYQHVDLGRIHVPYQDAEATEQAIVQNQISILVVDTYSVDEKYLQAMKPKVGLLVVFDDYMHLKKYHAHAVVNVNLYAHLLRYECDDDTELFLGTEFVQLREEFDSYQDFKRDNPAVARHILVTFGGSDFKGASMLSVKALKMLPDHFTATIIIGKSFRDGELLAKELGLDSRFIILQAVSDISKKMASCDLAITSPSTTLYELMLLKTPSVLITYVDNQAMIAEYAGKNGLAVSMGSIESVDPKLLSRTISRLIASKEERDNMSARIDDLVDGMGRFRLAEEILRLYSDKEAQEKSDL